MTNASDSRDFQPTAPWANLRLRARLLAQTRGFFAARGFLEVETPLLSADVVVDRHLDPLAVTLPDDPRQPARGRRLWLQTSPEFGMKRLLASGATAIYQITRAFRAAERGALHNPEFTIVEWYRRDDTLAAAMGLLSDLCQTLLDTPPAELLSYAEAFDRHARVDPHRATAHELAKLATRQGMASPDDIDALDRDESLNLILSHLVEPHLGLERPTILHSYPASQAALAQTSGDPPVAERFELYVRGIELANGYHELRDADVLAARAKAANAARQADGKPALPEDSRLLAAMRHGLPDCCGVAMGFDRVVMLAAGATSIDDVLAFPIERA